MWNLTNIYQDIFHCRWTQTLTIFRKHAAVVLHNAIYHRAKKGNYMYNKLFWSVISYYAIETVCCLKLRKYFYFYNASAWW
jgi:hypothetical protein